MSRPCAGNLHPTFLASFAVPPCKISHVAIRFFILPLPRSLWSIIKTCSFLSLTPLMVLNGIQTHLLSVPCVPNREVTPLSHYEKELYGFSPFLHTVSLPLFYLVTQIAFPVSPVVIGIWFASSLLTPPIPRSQLSGIL